MRGQLCHRRCIIYATGDKFFALELLIVTIATPDFPAFGVLDEPGETVGDISLGFNVTASEGWSGFLRDNYQFSDDLEAIAGSAGLRYSW